MGYMLEIKKHPQDIQQGDDQRKESPRRSGPEPEPGRLCHHHRRERSREIDDTERHSRKLAGGRGEYHHRRSGHYPAAGAQESRLSGAGVPGSHDRHRLHHVHEENMAIAAGEDTEEDSDGGFPEKREKSSRKSWRLWDWGWRSASPPRWGSCPAGRGRP
mgnify:CR=1 FL=1